MKSKKKFKEEKMENFKLKLSVFIAIGGILIASSGIFKGDDAGRNANSASDAPSKQEEIAYGSEASGGKLAQIFSALFAFGKEKEEKAPQEEAPTMPEIKLVETETTVGTSTIITLAPPPPPELSAQSFLSIFSYNDGKHSKVLTEQEADEKMPLASITKLMTAIVASQNISEDEEITISEDILGSEDDSYKFIANDTFSFRDLLYAMLIESNNDAAEAFAAKLGEDNFYILMNEKAQALGMRDTYYGNTTGLDPNIDSAPIINFSTAKDLATLAEDILKNYPEIFSATTLKEYDIYKLDGGFNHKAETTNKLLTFGDTLACAGKPINILGGKTGSTDLARKNLVLVTESPIENSHLVNIVLGSDDHFADMVSLIDWVCDSYEW